MSNRLGPRALHRSVGSDVNVDEATPVTSSLQTACKEGSCMRSRFRTMMRSAAWTGSEIMRRNGLWVIIALVATAGVIGSAMLASRGGAVTGERVVPNIGLNLFTAFLVAALIEIFSQIGESGELERIEESFKDSLALRARVRASPLSCPNLTWTRGTFGRSRPMDGTA
jgi:hypothetical protein